MSSNLTSPTISRMQRSIGKAPAGEVDAWRNCCGTGVVSAASSPKPPAAPLGLPRGSWFYPLLLMVAIFAASSRSQVAAPDVVNLDKVTHFAVFGLLATLIARTQPQRLWWLGAVLASVYGAFDELRQSFTPGRCVELADWVADTAGAALAVLLYVKWHPYRNWLERPLFRRPERRIANAAPAGPDHRV